MVKLTIVNGVQIPKANNELDAWYKQLFGNIIKFGTHKEDRTGTGTISTFGHQFEWDMQKGFPLLTSKKMHHKGVLIELLWFLGAHMLDKRNVRVGRTNIRYMLEHGCDIWLGDAYKRYVTECSANDVENRWLKKIEVETTTGPEESYTLLKRDEFKHKIIDDRQFCKKWGHLGPIYGSQWRNFGPGEYTVSAPMETVLCEKVPTIEDVFDAVEDDLCEMPITNILEYRENGGVDQIAQLVEDLKNNPDSRRLMVTAWNPTELPRMVLPPCHYGFQCYTRLLTVSERFDLMTKHPKFDVVQDLGIPVPEISHELIDSLYPDTPTRGLSLMWNQRSVDTPLGLPFNIASYGFLLEMLAATVNMMPDRLLGNLGDTHIYNDQLAATAIQIANDTFPLPKLKLRRRDKLEEYVPADFVIEGYQSAGKVEYPLSN